MGLLDFDDEELEPTHKTIKVRQVDPQRPWLVSYKNKIVPIDYKQET